MAKVKIEAGAEFDVLTEEEMKKGFADWLKEVAIGVRFRKFSATAVKPAAGNWTFDPTTANNRAGQTGPEPGFLWAVTSIAVSGPAITAGTDLFNIYEDEISATRLFRQRVLNDATFDVGVFVLDGGGSIALTGASTAGVAGDPIYISGRAAEVPVQLAWQLLG